MFDTGEEGVWCGGWTAVWKELMDMTCPRVPVEVLRLSMFEHSGSAEEGGR